jgi:hypothetical protein
MTLFRLLLLAIVGFFVWRAVRIYLRMKGSGRYQGDDDLPKPPPPSPEMPRYTDIQDADFEDLTSSTEEKPPPKDT